MITQECPAGRDGAPDDLAEPGKQAIVADVAEVIRRQNHHAFDAMFESGARQVHGLLQAGSARAH